MSEPESIFINIQESYCMLLALQMQHQHLWIKEALSGDKKSKFWQNFQLCDGQTDGPKHGLTDRLTDRQSDSKSRMYATKNWAWNAKEFNLC